MRLRTFGIAMLAIVALLAQSAPARADTVHDSLDQAVNSYRASRGLPTVVASPTLQAAAQFMAENVATYGPPATPHISTDGRTPQQRMADAGYPVSSAVTGEIIAWGATSAQGAMNLWLNSAPHYAMLNDGRFYAAGFGVACWGAYPCVWVVDFGSIVDATFASSVGAPAVAAGDYHAAFASQSPYPVASPGQTVEWVIAYTNTGSTGWYTSLGTQLRLGTWRPQDAPSVLATATWVAPNRPAHQATSYVGPGQIAWFRVDMLAPSQPGTYRLYVRPVIDGVAWLEDVGAYVDLVVR